MIQKAVADYFAATRAMDTSALVAAFSEDGTSYEPATPPASGHEALRQFFEGIMAAFSEVGLTEDNVFITGNEAAVKWTGRGVGVNGREVMFEGIDVFEINDAGKIQNVWAYWNPAALMSQLQ
jgi:steroid delta-isomerase